METSITNSPAPSTSPTEVPKNHTNETKSISNKEDGKQSDEKELKNDLLKEVMLYILEADMDELISVKGYFKGIFPKKLKIKNTDLKASLIKDERQGRVNICYSNMLRQDDGTWKKVAIKRAILPENDKFIQQEAAVLSQLNHENIIKFYGKCEDKPEIVLEFMDHLDFVVQLNKFRFTTANLLRILEEVACGMEYISKRQYLHRNLTCQNVFFNAQKQCKIGNFGFAVYVENSNGVYVEEDCFIDDEDPRVFHGSSCSIFSSYLAPETLDTQTFSTATDVWSMGLFCWETFAFADRSTQPLHPGIAFKTFSSSKTELLRNQNCPEILYQYITRDLLNLDPMKRPRFPAIRTEIKEIAINLTV